MRTQALLCFVLLLTSCSQQQQERTEEQGAWTAESLQFARSFSIETRDAERRLVVFGPGGRSDTVGIHLVGSAAIPLPLQRLAVVSTTHLAYIQVLERLEVLVGAAHIDRTADPELRTWLQNNVPDIGRADGLDRELLITLAPQVVLDYPFGQGSSTQHLQGTQRVAVTEYLEEHPLGRAEWLRFFGVLLGREKQADSLFNAIVHRYHKSTFQGNSSRPSVFFGSAWQGRWFVPPGNSYMATLIKDAGGVYLFADKQGGENLALDLETVLDRCANADHFGAILAQEGTVEAHHLVGGDTRLASSKAVAQGGFVGNSATNDLFGMALLEPDLILQDLRCIFHPEQCVGHVPRYFVSIAQ